MASRKRKKGGVPAGRGSKKKAPAPARRCHYCDRTGAKVRSEGRWYHAKCLAALRRSEAARKGWKTRQKRARVVEREIERRVRAELARRDRLNRKRRHKRKRKKIEGLEDAFIIEAEERGISLRELYTLFFSPEVTAA